MLKNANSQVGQIWDNQWRSINDLDLFSDIEKSNDKWTENHREIIDKYLRKLPNNSVFIEAGCGLGQWCFYAQKKYGISSIGVDIAKETINRLEEYVLKNKIIGVKFIFDDLTSSDIKDEIGDFFISLGVIEHFHDSNPIVKNMHRMTKKGGYGLITVPNVYSFHTILRPMAKIFGKWKIGLERSFSPNYLRKMCKNNGFEIIECGVLPSGEIFGHVVNSIPIFGNFFKKISYFIENNQKTWGFISYVIVRKN